MMDNDETELERRYVNKRCTLQQKSKAYCSRNKWDIFVLCSLSARNKTF